MKYIICATVIAICAIVGLSVYGDKRVFNKLEDTLEQQERKELRFELCFKIVPLLLLYAIVILIVVLKCKNVV